MVNPMRVFRPLLGAVAAFALLVPAAASGDAQPSGGAGPQRVPAGTEPFDLGPEWCGFPIHVDIVKDKQYVTTRTSADGSTRISILGQLVMRFTNVNTGASITRNVSGPTFVTVFADGTIRVVLTGRSFLTVDPPSQANSGLPGLVFPTGRFVGIADATNTLVSYSATGQLTDGCALLS